ncbi:MAG: HAMP domain-containing protein [Anaerolineae bacterium]|nr:HAMP domain-containing protein [Anaerolineae bacterium]
MRTNRGRLRSKIIAWFLIPAAVISIGVALLTFYAYQRVTEDLVLARNRDHSLLLANQLGTQLAGYVQPLAVLASTERIDSAVLEGSWYADARPFDGGLLLLDPAGQIVAGVPSHPEVVGQRVPAMVYEDGEAHYSNIIGGLIPGMDVIAISWPLSGLENQDQGVLVGLFRAERGATRTSTFYQDIWGLYIGRREVAYVVDGNGRVVFHPDTFLIGDDFSGQEPVQRALRGETGAIRTLDREGKKVVAGFAPVPGTSWGLVTEESWADLIEASQPYTRFLLVLLALGVLIPVVVAALGARRITEPLTRLTEAARRIAGGSFDQSIDVRTGDELEVLADQFNAMAADLQTSYATLEQRVADRTRELATLNEISAVVSRSLELNQVLEAALTETLGALDMEAGAAFRLEEGDTLVMMASRGLSAPFARRVERLPLSESLAAQAVGERVPSARSVDAYPGGALKALLQEEGLRMVVSVPLIAKDAVLGVLNLATRTPRAITREERALLAAIGQQAGVAVENARLYEQAEATAAEAERIRLARELHDAVSQTLFSASLIADVLPRLWARDPEEGQRRLEILRKLARGAMAEMRALLVELRPATLVKADMAELLRQLAEAVIGRSQTDVVVDIEPTPSLPAEVKVAFYRIAQEALNNVIKHARARHVEVRFGARNGVIALHVRDDGCGFDPSDVPSGHFGLGNIYERAEAIGAGVSVDSALGCGTQITVTWRQDGE